jgi:hypothetical protein
MKASHTPPVNVVVRFKLKKKDIIIKMITLILVIPIIGSIMLLLQSYSQTDLNNSDLKMKEIALTTSLINLFISLLL